MPTETIKRFKWFWAWEDEKEEQWLGEMSQQGWHLKLASFQTPGIYRFEKGTPHAYIYRLDYSLSRQEKGCQNYVQLFRDAGWEHLGEFGGWQYFRIEAKGNDLPEIYSNTASKVAKYQRTLLLYLPLIPFFILMISEPGAWRGLFFQSLYGLWVFIILIYIFNSVMLLKRIQQLKKKF